MVSGKILHPDKQFFLYFLSFLWISAAQLAWMSSLVRRKNLNVVPSNGLRWRFCLNDNNFISHPMNGCQFSSSMHCNKNCHFYLQRPNLKSSHIDKDGHWLPHWFTKLLHFYSIPDILQEGIWALPFQKTTMKIENTDQMLPKWDCSSSTNQGDLNLMIENELIKLFYEM